MKDFIHTGWWAPTLTTTEDPWLKVIERDNGVSWTITFYVGEHIIDHINMEWCRGTKLDKDVLRLPVYSDEGIYLGSLAKRLEDAINVMYPEPMFKTGE
jgi:hypothetical protein